MGEATAATDRQPMYRNLDIDSLLRHAALHTQPGGRAAVTNQTATVTAAPSPSGSSEKEAANARG